MFTEWPRDEREGDDSAERGGGEEEEEEEEEERYSQHQMDL